VYLDNKELFMSAAITFKGHNVEVTPALKQYVTEKFERLTRRGDSITSIAVILKVEKLSQIAESTIHVKGRDLHASAEHSDMYAAIDSLVDKLNTQIVKHRDGQTGHH
jgi:putative sigma-54 modulation protein